MHTIEDFVCGYFYLV